MSENQPESHEETPEERRARRSQWPAKIYHNRETDEADKKAYYRSLTPQQRLEILFELTKIDGPEPRLDRTPRITQRKES